jgi:fatty-acyl-CoA synthase
MREWFEKTTKDLSRDVDRAARALLALGIEPGHKVALWLNNRPEWIHLMFAIVRVGAVLVPVNTRLRSGEVAYILKQSNSTTLIAAHRSGPVDYLAMVRELLPGLTEAAPAALASPDFPDLRRVILLGPEAEPGTLHWPEVLETGESIRPEQLAERADAVSPDDIAYIMYTSGTTGFPKGVMQDHAIVRNVLDRINRMAITAEDVILMYLPLFHIFGFGEGPLVSILSGAREVLTATFDPVECLELIERERATLAHGFDVHFRDLMNAQESRPRELGSLRTGLLAAGMHNSTAIARKAQQVLMPTLSCFGMSECGVGAGLSHLNSTAEQRCESSGFPAPGYEFRIIDPASGKEQPTGTPGEILVKGYMVMRGYYEKPEETARAIDAEGWLHSGDMGVLRPDGCLRFIENVDPMEVEGVLLEHAAVHGVAVVGYPDERLSEVGVAFVQPSPGSSTTGEELIVHCKAHLAGFKVPRHVLFVEDFPMTGSGKIQKVKLRELALEQIRSASAATVPE